MKNYRVLITGGAGLVGSHIADLLGREGVAEIIILDNFSRGKLANLNTAKKQSNLTIIKGDIRDRLLLTKVMQGVDLVFHQATIPLHQSLQEPLLALESLADGTFNVLEAAVRARVKKIIAASSTSIYGMTDQFPTPQSDHYYDHHTLDVAAKVFNETLLRSFYDMYGLDYVALRYFNVYGPRMDIHGVCTEVLLNWLERLSAGQPPVICGNGTETIDIISVEDIARANIMAANSSITDEVFNIASGVETSLHDLASTLTQVMGCDLPLEYNPEPKVKSVQPGLTDVSKAREMLGFEATIPLQEGLQRLVSWWQAEQQLKATSSYV